MTAVGATAVGVTAVGVTVVGVTAFRYHPKLGTILNIILWWSLCIAHYNAQCLLYGLQWK